MRGCIGLWIACLWACNPINGVKISGNLLHYKGNKLYFEVCGQDTTIAVALDSTGAFEADLPLVKAGYVRLANGKAAFPLFLQPGKSVRLKMDVKSVLEGDYESVEFLEGSNPETRMMVDYYQKQWFPSTQEMFVLPPSDFKQLMDSIVRFNDRIISAFVKKNTCDPVFVQLFRIQVKVPLAASYFYYPMYHSLLNREDKSDIPADFNIFDRMLPKNDIDVYRDVYRYKIYEVSYWNNLLGEKLANLMSEPGQFVNAYIDELNNLGLHEQIRDDIGNNFVMQYCNELPEEAVSILKNRYKEIVVNPKYLKEIEHVFQNVLP